MCRDKYETAKTLRKVLSRMKDCLLEARAPLVKLAVQAVMQLFHKKKGGLNGEKDNASFNT